MNLRERLENLIANPRLVAAGRDLKFAQSLLRYYEAKGRLTAGRRVWIDKLEAKYAADAPDVGCKTMNARIEDLLKVVEVGSWDERFLCSVAEQNRQGELSARQKEIIERIEKNNSEESVKERDGWFSNFTEDMRTRMEVVARYYKANPPYYADFAAKVLDSADWIPTQRQYQKFVGNKFAVKVLEAHFATPEFAVGSKIEGRSSAPRSIRGKKGFVLKTDAKPVTNAARGTKIYMILPVGEATPVFVEERYIKKGRF